MTQPGTIGHRLRGVVLAFALLVAATVVVTVGGMGSALAVTAPAPALHVAGNRLVTGAGAAYRLLGVNRSSGEFACVQGKGMWDSGPVDQASVDAMKTWAIKAVRIPLNEECWLGVSGTPSGATYQQNVKDYVNLLVANGITPIVEMHWSHGQYTGPGNGCADVAATCQKPMPDAQYAPTFWTQVANAFPDNRVVFDLFNEPYPDAAANWDATAAWTCWRDGGTCVGIDYPVAGFQSLVDAVRATGNTNVIMIGGVAWSNDLSHWLQYAPTDPAGNLMAAWHTYNFNSCSNTSCWDSQVAPVAASVPVTTGEVGQNSCAHDYIDTVMSWLDAHAIGYLAWTWNPWGCSGGNVLIQDYAGTPTVSYGEGYKAHLLSLSTGGDTTAPSAPGTPSASGVTATGAALSWAASTDTGGSGLAGYDVYRAQASGDTVLAHASTNSATLTGLSPNTAYTVYVRARDGAGNLSAPSPAVSFTTAGSGGGTCRVTYATSDWATGFTATVTIANTGSGPLDGWTLAFDFPGNQRVTNGWSATWTQQSGSAHVTATNLSWNGSIAPGSSVGIGFNGSFSGANPAPAAFTLNGATCTTG